MPFSPPDNVGILTMGIYFPNKYVEQSELETFNGVSPGKYTIGLAQEKMGFCDDREDIYSIALTALSKFLHENAIDPLTIGRLEVGTETILDKSKSVKSVLMQLFSPSGNTDILGVDTMNACYGGTNALFNAVNWVESRGWDGRNAIVVAADIALYAKGNARPTGGAGAICMLVGPDAPLALEPGLVGTHMEHTYDFYKADLSSEYPIVDGHYSINCYTQALDKCYQAYNVKCAKKQKHLTNGLTNGFTNGHKEEPRGIDRFASIAFHVPTCKVVQKSYARLLYNDYLTDKDHPAFHNLPQSIREIDYHASLTDKTVEKTFMALTEEKYKQTIFPGLLCPRNIGNMYTASVYSSLASIISEISSDELVGRRVGVFSYGSGLAASFFSIKVLGPVDHIAKALRVRKLLDERIKVSPEDHERMLGLREVMKEHGRGYVPQGSIASLRKGTYYLTKIDQKYRREYAIKE